MIQIDASQGNGGGLILRGALVLSSITGQAVRLTRIRARRCSPGLKPQHLRLVEVMARLCDASVEGASIGSQTLLFEPRGDVRGGGLIDVATPGSVTLLLQTLFLPLAFSGRITRLRLSGITHAPRSPSPESLAWNWLPMLEDAGYRGETSLQKVGFAPRGGGIVHATIHPVATPIPLSLTERGRLLRVGGLSSVAGLDFSVAERQRRHVVSRLQGLHVPVEVVPGVVSAAVPGAFVFLTAEFEHARQSFFAPGQLGKPAETVAGEAVDALLASLGGGGAVDQHLANQLLLPLAFADGMSEIATSRVGEHLLAMAELIGRFFPASVDVHGSVGEPGTIAVHGAGVPARSHEQPPLDVGSLPEWHGMAAAAAASASLPLPAR